MDVAKRFEKYCTVGIGDNLHLMNVIMVIGSLHVKKPSRKSIDLIELFSVIQILLKL